MVFFNAENVLGCDTFISVKDIVSIVKINAQDNVLVGMRNGERYKFSGDIIRREYTKMFPTRDTDKEIKNIAKQLYEVISAFDKWTK